jgi:hypothetical protein
MIAYKLDKDINGQELLSSIQNLINKSRENNSLADSILIIKIANISHDDTSMIPKLEYKEST